MFIKLVSYTHQNLQTDSQSAQLSVIAGVITTFGDAHATMATVLQ